MATSAGTRAYCGRLLLFAALLFGIVTMHTLGHPTGDHGSTTPAASTGTGAGAGAEHSGHGTAMTAASGTSMTAGVPRSDARARHAAAPAPLDPAADDPVAGDPVAGGHGQPGHGLDPMAVCLAVLLGTVTFALLAAVLRPGARPAPLVPRAPPRLRYRPAPPPPRTLLSRLSVLRI